MYNCDDKNYDPGNMTVFEFVMEQECVQDRPNGISSERWVAMQTWYANRIREGFSDYQISVYLT